MIKVGTIVSDITANMNPFRKSMTRVEKEGEQAARSVGKKFQQMGQSMRSVGGTMTRNITLPIAAASAAIFKFGSDFEAEMSKITGLVGVASDQTDEWSTQIRDMAGEVGRGPKELAQAMFFVTSAGFRGAQAMEVLEMSAKASAAGLGETKAVADLVTSAINAYGKENISAARATDVLTAAVREGKLEAETLAPVMGRLLPMANDLGIQFDELSGFMAAMSRTGLEATEASTALRGIMKVLVKPTQEAREQLEAVGLSFQDLRTQVKDEGLLSVLKDLQTAFAGNEEAMANVFPDVRGLIGVLNVLGQDSKVVSDIMDGVSNSSGDMQTAFDEAAKTGRHAFNQMMAEAHSLTTDFFDGLKGSLVPVIRQVTSLLSGMRSVWRGMSDGAKQATGVITGLAAAIGPAALGLGWAIKLTIPAVTTLTKVVKGLTAAMIKNPYIAVGAAIAYIASRAIFARQELNSLHAEVSTLLQSESATLDQVNQKIAEIGELYSQAADNAADIPGKTAEDLIDPQITKQLQKLVQLRDRLAGDGIVSPEMNANLDVTRQLLSFINTDLSNFASSGGLSALTDTEALQTANATAVSFTNTLGLMNPKLNVMANGLQMAKGAASSVSEAMKVTRDEVSKAAQAGGQFGQMMGNALSQAVLHANSLLDTLKNLAKQLASKVLTQGLTMLLSGGTMGGGGLIGSILGGIFHNGGIVGGSGDVPIMAKAGEGVFTEGQMKAMGGLIRGGGSGMNEDKLSRAFDRALANRLQKLGPEEIYTLNRKGQFSY